MLDHALRDPRSFSVLAVEMMSLGQYALGGENRQGNAGRLPQVNGSLRCLNGQAMLAGAQLSGCEADQRLYLMSRLVELVARLDRTLNSSRAGA
jgi:hypothetical protein